MLPTSAIGFDHAKLFHLKVPTKCSIIVRNNYGVPHNKWCFLVSSIGFVTAMKDTIIRVRVSYQ